MIREFTFTDVLYLVAAMRWTLALTAIAFIGGGIVGLVIALLRVSHLAPLRWIGTTYVLAVQGTLRAVWMANELSRRQALQQVSSLVSLGTQYDNIDSGQQTFQAPRPEWRLR